MLNRLMKEDVVWQRLNVEDVLADGNYPVTTAYIDVSRFRRFGFKVSCGALADAMTFQVWQDTSATEAAIKVVTGAVLVFTATDDDKWGIIEIDESMLDVNNDFRYITCIVSGVSGSNYAAIDFFGYGARKLPVTQGADNFANAQVVSN